MKNHFLSTSIKFFAIVGVSTTTWAYVVKKGDTVSKIAYQNISKKIYGNDGAINKILKLNPQIKNPNFIKPGEVINFDEKVPLELSKVSLERQPGEDPVSSSPNDIEKHVEELADDTAHVFKPDGLLVLNPFYAIKNLSTIDKTTGSESTIASKYNVGLSAYYVQEWSKDFQTAVNLKLSTIGFEEPASSTRALQDKSKFLSSLGLETNHNFGLNTQLKLGVSYGKELFIRASSTQSVAVDAIDIPSISSKISYDIKKLSPFTLGISASYSAKFPAKTDFYDVKFGHEYGASIYLNQLTGKSRLSTIQTELGFSQRAQNTSVTTQNETSLMLGVRFFFDVGSGS
jgi:hypothetical protein